MSTSIKTLMTRGVWIDLIVSLLCLIFFVVYQQFAHGVTSPYMSFLFAIPLIFGAAVLIGFNALQLPRPRYWISFTYNGGLAAWTLASLLTGIFEIAGTSSLYAASLMVFGQTMMVIGVIGYMVELYARLSSSHA